MINGVVIFYDGENLGLRGLSCGWGEIKSFFLKYVHVFSHIHVRYQLNKYLDMWYWSSNEKVKAGDRKDLKNWRGREEGKIDRQLDEGVERYIREFRVFKAIDMDEIPTICIDREGQSSKHWILGHSYI